MPTVLLIRHGLTAQTGPVLTGWTPGVPLDARGLAQVERTAARLAPLKLDAVVSSPLQRCEETARAVLKGRALGLETDEAFGEVRYGDWTGRKLAELAKEPLWKVVQAHPSAVTFPGGESLAAAQHRAVQAVRAWNDKLGPDAVYAVCSHGDIIKALAADALGLHLDQFQRIQVDPASVTVIRYTELRPFLVRLNDTGGGVEGLVPPNPGSGDAAVGGGA
ncbi:MSMEG_4193 family putative phosphomutase [Actinocorallia sp. A-T 12471]|uniref:MSMEG_4193 family putative phosphomutase n=1 Tax=Actinocorallia sp. A-T 12471 TaxID=3089813 RepID=UPI0029CF942C|nr:MSMEG_4193 family putative phosphomutase [Actinocorallia sp. A-T 12471]MDX6744308.1 MSMEG_4193 family putative phosphomutase [Actinocorallia sp. A-T 12471]